MNRRKAIRQRKDILGAETMIRRQIIFYGWVQGVGLRYRARHAAAAFGCSGWIRNEWDGSVTMEIQGTEEQIVKVVAAVETGQYVRIEEMESRLIPTIYGESGFRVE